MADEYTPTTDEVRSLFCVGILRPLNPAPVPAQDALDGFDRFLTAYEAEVRERIAQEEQPDDRPQIVRNA